MEERKRKKERARRRSRKSSQRTLFECICVFICCKWQQYFPFGGLTLSGYTLSTWRHSASSQWKCLYDGRCNEANKSNAFVWTFVHALRLQKYRSNLSLGHMKQIQKIQWNCIPFYRANDAQQSVSHSLLGMLCIRFEILWYGWEKNRKWKIKTNKNRIRKSNDGTWRIGKNAPGTM